MVRLAMFDAHCHLQDPRIAHCVPQLIKQASEAGVRWFAVNGTSEEDWGLVKKMGETYETVIPNFGLHPWWIPKRSDNWLPILREMLESEPTAAVGEIGLDLGARGKTIDEAVQIDILWEQLTLARELQRPASVHCVRAHGPLQDLLLSMGTFPAGIIMHSFTGPAASVRGLLEHGAYFSFSGFLTPLKDSKAKAVLQQVPLDRILIETDAPYALPREDLGPFLWVPEDAGAASQGDSQGADDEPCCSSKDDNGTGKRQEQCAKGALNHPANIKAVLSFVSSAMGISEDELSARALENATRLFTFAGSKLVS